MEKIVLYGLMTVMLSLIGLSLIAFSLKKRRQTEINIAVSDVTIRDLFESYRFSNKVDLGQIASFILTIDQNGFDGILGDLRAQAVLVQSTSDKTAQKQAYLKFLGLYVKKREKFKKSLLFKTNQNQLMQLGFGLTLMVGLSFLALPLLGFDDVASKLVSWIVFL